MKYIKVKSVRSLSELDRLAKTDDNYKRLILSACRNIGADGPLFDKKNPRPKWIIARGQLDVWLMSMVSEYGQDEGKAERDLLGEINNVRDCIDPTEEVG